MSAAMLDLELKILDPRLGAGISTSRMLRVPGSRRAGVAAP